MPKMTRPVGLRKVRKYWTGYVMGQSELTALTGQTCSIKKEEIPENLTIPPENGKNGNYSGIEAVFWDLLLKTVWKNG